MIEQLFPYKTVHITVGLFVIVKIQLLSWYKKPNLITALVFLEKYLPAALA